MRLATQWLDDASNVDDLALFLDFDGTLAPIIERPGDAQALQGVAGLVKAIGDHIPVAIISGRGLDDVTQRLGAKGIYYAGSHGLEIQEPDGARHEPEELEKIGPEIQRQEEWLRDRLDEEPGIEIETKRFAVAIHFRRRPDAREWVEDLIQEAIEGSQGLTMSVGKMVREIQPDIERDKGTALRFIRERLDPDRRRRPLYIGDDVTDEDAFREIGDDGLGVLVSEKERETAASLRLDDPQAVRDFLQRLAKRLGDQP